MPVKLKNLFSKFGSTALADVSVSGISDDSRTVNRGDLFFIIQKKNFDIFSVLAKIEPKVTAFVAEKSQSQKLSKIIKYKPIIYRDNLKRDFFRAIDRFYKFKDNKVKVIGITGTNGKTTVSTLVYYLLGRLGLEASLIGTVKHCLGDQIYQPENTTPGFLSLRKFLKQANDSGSKFLVMEVSSHAIAQERISGINFERCLFTNLGRDHLDYHHSQLEYFKVKKRLFVANRKQIALINIDDPYGVKLFYALPKSLTYGTKSTSDFRIYQPSLTKSGSRFILEHRRIQYLIKTNLCGRHNVYNVAAAFSLLVSLGLPPKKIAENIGSFNNVEGRLERVGESIFIDYAHTPDALKTVLLALGEIGYEDIICLFGCGGDRDKGKRKLMGQVAANYANFSIITSDNPRSEDPETICRQIEAGFRKPNYKIVINRRKAIKEAVRLLAKVKSNSTKKRSCLLVAGKGHEDYQIIGKRKIAFKDSRVVRESLRQAIKTKTK